MLSTQIGRLCELRCENGETYLLEVMSVEQHVNCFDIDSREINLSGFLLRSFKPLAFRPSFLEYEKVIYHNPATIVLWKDGTKTVVKCDPKDIYDPAKGLALCFMKKALGNTSRAFNDILHKEADAQ